MRLPKQVHVGPYKYPVYVVKKVDWSENTIACFDTQNGIQIQDKMPKDIEAEAFLHELMHAVWYTMNLQKHSVLRDYEEGVVSSMTTGLATMLKQNPKLLDYLKASLK